jgi:hypothetical protein
VDARHTFKNRKCIGHRPTIDYQPPTIDNEPPHTELPAGAIIVAHLRRAE